MSAAASATARSGAAGPAESATPPGAATPRSQAIPAGPSRACRLVRTPTDLARHFAVRRAVFVGEQRLFVGSDRDARDDDPATLHALAFAGGRPAGAVRLYPIDGAGLWKGDRLAVLPAFRHGLLGAALVELAVRTAGERGGARMVAMIQLPNVRFFEALGWRASGAAGPYHGRVHQPMEIPLSRPGR